MKTIHFLVLLLSLCFSGNAFARLSDQEKIIIIREMAEPSFKEQTSYRWVSQKDRTEMHLDGKVTQEIYEYFMQFREHFSLAGAGLYVYESPEEGLLEGEVPIQMETAKGYRYLNLSDEEILRQLKVKGITLEDVYRLNSNVALKLPRKSFSELDREGDWEGLTGRVLYDSHKPVLVFKGRKGVRITPFTGEGVSLNTLTGVLLHDDLSKEQKKYFLDSVKENIKKRAARYIALLDSKNKKKKSEKKMNKEFYELSMGTDEYYQSRRR